MAFQGDSIFWVEVEKIVPNPFQPRREFDEAKLKELAESVRMYGILQPMTVTRREVPNDDGSFRTEYELIAGERRLRASKLAGIAQVPVIIRDGEQSEQEKLELAIIENLQREDLNAVDRALAFRQLADVFDLSHAQVAKKVGRSREYVSNSIRILALPDYMLDAVRSGDISEGHARTLLMLNDRPEEQDTVFRETMLKKLSVREVERIARGIATEKVRKKESIDSDLLDLEKQFTETLGTRVSIVKTEFGGRLTIDYFSPDELQVMLTRMRDEQVAELQGESAAAVASLTASTPLEASPEPDNPAVETVSESDASVSEPALTKDTETTPAVTDTTVPAPAEPTEPAESPETEAVSTDVRDTPVTSQQPVAMPEPTAPEIEKETPAAPVENNTQTTAPVADAATTTPPRPMITPTMPETKEPVAPTAAEATQNAAADTPAQPLSLRDQLALMLQKKQSGQSTTTPVTPPAAAQSPRPDTPTQHTPAPTPKADDDDSDLYSMKNFTV